VSDASFPIHEAGLDSEFNEELKHEDKFVKVQRKSLEKIKEFVASKPELADLAEEIRTCDCPPNDPYCIYI
jgi:hypothetical protein